MLFHRPMMRRVTIETLRTPLLSYIAGIATPLVVMLVVEAIRPVLDRVPSPPFLAAVVLVAWYCGQRPALVATGVSALLLHYYLSPAAAPFVFNLPELVGLGLYGAIAVFTSWVAVRLHQTMRALEHERRREGAARSEAERHSREAQELRHLSRTLTQTTSPQAAGQRVAEAVKRLFRPTSVVVRLLEADGALVAVAIAGGNDVVAPGHVLPPGAGVVGLAVAERRMIVTESVLDDPRIYLPPVAREFHTKFQHQLIVATPLIVDDVVIGTLALNERRTRTFSEAELGLLQALANHAAVGIRNVQRFVDERKAREEAEAANRAKDEFLAMLGHELRNPLAAISSGISVLNRIGEPHRMATPAREIITRQVAHLRKLTDDLLDAARATTGKIVLSRKAVDLGDLTRRCWAILESTEAFRSHEARLRAESVWVDGDETRLAQVIENLLTNAFKYTPAGGTIVATVRREGTDAVIRVADSGIGISSGLLPRIFDLFVQGDRGLDRGKGGLGIGLTLVKRLVELHGGSVEAASAGLGQGSTFTVRLPSVASVMTSGPRDASGVSLTLRRRVLVIEDNVDARQMLRATLELDGHEVSEAGNGVTGLQQALSTRPDVAVIDIGLPGLDGYELARRLRATEAGAKMVLIAVSGYGQSEDQRRSAEAGFDRYLVKPVAAEALANAIHDAAAWH